MNAADAISQPYAFLLFVYGGALLALLAGLLRLLRRALGGRPLVCLGIDALFVLVAAGITAGAFLLGTSGAPRLFGFLGLGLGAFLTRISVKKPLFSEKRRKPGSEKNR